MFVGVSVAFFGYLIPMIDETPPVAPERASSTTSKFSGGVESRALGDGLVVRQARNSSTVIDRRPRST